MKCPECSAEVAKGKTIATVPLSDGSEIDILVSVLYCVECDDYCEVDTEIA
jgi:hypothetical protein